MQIFPVFLAQAGCPQQCIFCSRWQVAGGTEAAPPQAVAARLAALLPASGKGEVAFYGGSFTALEPELQEAYLATAAAFLAAGRIAGIRISTRPDAVDRATALRLAAAGVRTVELGCQSFSDAVLAASGRGHNAAAAARAVTALRGAGLGVGLQLMPGLPGADANEARASLVAALALAPDFLRIYPTVVLAGSRLAVAWQKGAYHPLELDAAVELCADLLLSCRRAGVPVIRLGLQGDAEFNRGVLAGPYHAAYGQLVVSRLWRRALHQLALQGGGPVDVPQCELSDAFGHRKSNLDYFADRRLPLAVHGDPDLPRGTLRQGRETFSLLQLAGRHHED
jgi:histone acetyltransferase (RNA polymerase elongator complex component)